MSNIIEINNLNYEVNNTKILSDINLMIEKGDYLTFRGPSGSGKSTLVRLIADMISPTSGEILYQGKNIDSYEPTNYRQEVSYSFQQPTLFGDTVKDNLKFPFEVRNKEFDESLAIKKLKQVNLDESYLKKEVNDLSGGQRQRIALLRNIMFPPKILILDEVTAGLDEENEKIVLDIIDELNKDYKITILMITHIQNEIETAKKIITIEDGKIKGE